MTTASTAQASGRRGGMAAALALALLAPGAPALADVLEIAPDGTVRTFAGPVIYTRDGAVPVLPPAEPAAPQQDTAPPAPAAPVAPADIAGFIDEAARLQALDPALLHAVARQESGYRVRAVSPAGAIGVMQLMPATARALGVDPWDARQNVHGGAAYLRAMLDRFGGVLPLALAAYNAGPAAVDRYRDVPPFPETQTYVRAVSARYAALSGRGGH